MKIEINGRKYTSFLAATATISIDALTNTFSFSSSANKRIDFEFGVEDECVIYADGDKIETGHVEIISGSGTGNSYTIDITGRDNTGDIVDSMIGTLNDIKAPIKLKKVVEIVIAHIGAEIDVVDETGFEFEEAEDSLAPEAGDNAFKFLEKIARIKKAILTSNANGDVVIERAAGEIIKAQITNVVNGSRNNVINYSFSFDNTGRFNRYESIGNSNINLLSILGSQTPKSVVDKRGFITDKRIREGRQFIISSESPGSSPKMKERAQWEANIRKARSKVYTATVSGFRNQTGNLWTPNTIIRIRDDHAKINDSMLINSVTYRLDEDGRTTEISLIHKDAYSLEVDEPVKESESGSSLADAFAKILAEEEE